MTTNELHRHETRNSLHTIRSQASSYFKNIDHQDVPEHVESDEEPDLSLANMGQYCITRISSLMEVKIVNLKDLNPFIDLKDMSANNWNYFFMGFLAWLSASFDFFCTSVAGSKIAESLNVTTADITWGLSAVLMVRSSGAIIFGYWTDNYSRKWPFIFCAMMFMVLQIATGFVKSYQTFLLVRALSGVSMGGTYACSAATSLDDSPVKARSFLSGLFFSAYACGFIFATIFWRAFQNTQHSWKALFWFSSGIPACLIVWRLMFPETKYFQRVKKARELIIEDKKKAGVYVKPSFKTKMATVWSLTQKNWLMFIYLILLLTGGNYLTHASQDLYPSMLRKQLKMSEDAITVAIVVVNLGAIAGSLITGLVMEVLGRRLSLLVVCILGGCFVYPAYMLHNSSAILGGGFAEFFAVMGVWGVIPIHLSELSPPDARALVSGLAYQLGNLASAASSTIETNLANKYPLEFDSTGKAIRFDYAKVMAILTGAVFIYTFVIVLIGPEKFHRDLSSPIMKKYIGKVIEREQDQELGYSKQDSSSDQDSQMKANIDQISNVEVGFNGTKQ